jgi:hypothetical protein
MLAESPLLAAAKAGRLGDLTHALSGDVDVNEVDMESGKSALHCACACGHANIVSALVVLPDIGINLQDFDGNTPLHLAAEAGEKLIVKNLLEAGAQLTYRTCCGRTAEQIARQNGHISVDHFDCFDLIAEKASAAANEMEAGNTDNTLSTIEHAAVDAATGAAVGASAGAASGAASGAATSAVAGAASGAAVSAVAGAAPKRKLEVTGMSSIDLPLLELLGQFGLDQYADSLGSKGLTNSRMLATITETAEEVEKFLQETCRAKTFAQLAFRKLIKRVHGKSEG